MSTHLLSIKEAQIAEAFQPQSSTRPQLSALTQTTAQALQEGETEIRSELVAKQKKLLEESGLAQ